MNKNKKINLIIIFVIITIISLVIIYFSLKNINSKTFAVSSNPNQSQTCDIHSCNAIDPVSDPAYNMKQIIKQSILLEEHLVEKNKRCRDCIAKHFLHIQALHSEAVWLANKNINDYPLLEDTVGFYNEQFDLWLQYQTDDEQILKIASSLRDVRKKLVAVYYFNDKLIE